MELTQPLKAGVFMSVVGGYIIEKIYGLVRYSLMYGNGYFKMFGDLYLVRGLGLLAISLFTLLLMVALSFQG